MTNRLPLTVIPAQAGIHFALRAKCKIKMDSGFRRNDGNVVRRHCTRRHRCRRRHMACEQARPTAGAASETIDARGTSWLTDGVHRSPTGNLYMCPGRAARDIRARRLDLVRNAADRRGPRPAATTTTSSGTGYVHWDSGLILGLLDYTWERSRRRHLRERAREPNQRRRRVLPGPCSAARGQLQGAGRSCARCRTQLSNNAKPIWNGVGTGNLTLPAGLTPGGSTSEQVAAVSAATPERTLSVKRDKQGLGFSIVPLAEWNRLREPHRRGTHGRRVRMAARSSSTSRSRTTAAVLETTKPIDDSTINPQRRFSLRGFSLAHGLRLSGLVLSRPLPQLQLRVAVRAFARRHGCDVRAALSGPDVDGARQRLQQSQCDPSRASCRGTARSR